MPGTGETSALGALGDHEIDHIGLAVPSIADQLPLYEHLLGGSFVEGGDVADDFRTVQFLLPGRFKVELLEPINEDGGLAEFLSTHGSGLHHITVRCGNLVDSIASATDGGYRIVGRNLADLHWREAYIHPKDTGGMLIQLFDSHNATTENGCGYRVDDVLAGAMVWGAGVFTPRVTAT